MTSVRSFEEISGQSLQQFFDQWLFGSGHPELDIGFSQDPSNVILSVFQTQSDDKIFSFPLEIKLAITSSEGKLDIIKRTIEVSQTKTEIAFQIPSGGIVEWFSIDPDFKIVKDVKNVKAPVHFLLTKLMNRKDTTVIERIEAASNLRKIPPDDSIIDTLKKAILEEDLSLDDTFWGVSLEAARTLESMAPSNKIYDILVQCFASVDHPKTKTAIMKALRIFDNPELLGLFQKVLDDNNQSHNVQQQGAIGIGKMADGNTFNLLKRHLETESFQNLVAQGAITGLRIFGTVQRIQRLLHRLLRC